MKNSTTNTRHVIACLAMIVCLVVLGTGSVGAEQDPLGKPGTGPGREAFQEPDTFLAETYEEDPALTEERPCGRDTIARIQAENGNFVTFCQAGGGILVNELGPLGAEMNVERFDLRRNGPLHLFKSIAGNDAVAPGRLVEEDAMWRWAEEARGSGGADEHSAPRQAGDAFRGSTWCDSGAAWANDRCYASEHSTDDVKLCGSGAYNWHQRTCSSSISGYTPCLWGDSDLVSCNGRTTHRYYWRDNTGGSFQLKGSVVVPDDYWSHYVAYSDVWGDDFRFRGDEYDTSAWHRYYAGFEDD